MKAGEIAYQMTSYRDIGVSQLDVYSRIPLLVMSRDIKSLREFSGYAYPTAYEGLVRQVYQNPAWTKDKVGLDIEAGCLKENMEHRAYQEKAAKVAKAAEAVELKAKKDKENSRQELANRISQCRADNPVPEKVDSLHACIFHAESMQKPAVSRSKEMNDCTRGPNGEPQFYYCNEMSIQQPVVTHKAHHAQGK